MGNNWQPHTWQYFPNPQGIRYPCSETLKNVINTLKQATPLVSANEIKQLHNTLQKTYNGDAFVLQAGDCAERFSDCNHERVFAQSQLLLRLSNILEQHLQKKIITVARIAGQYAKPRSTLYETRDTTTFMSYRGDMINNPQFTASARMPRVEHLLQAYTCAQFILEQLTEFTLAHQKIYTSHEALNLYYEQALTRYDEEQQSYFNLSTHLPWVGMRTAQLNSAHIEYLRGIANPVAIKVGPHLSSNALLKLINRLNPNHTIAKVIIILRLGAEHITRSLPRLLKPVISAQLPVLWFIDPMHGNTYFDNQAKKVRDCETIEYELVTAINIFNDMHATLHGVHLELTADPIYECRDKTEFDTQQTLTNAYQSLVDPRLNSQQAISLIRAASTSLCTPVTQNMITA